jgi:hypothetical protein
VVLKGTREHFEGQGTEGRTILKWIFKKQEGMARNGMIWLLMGIKGRLLKTW